MASVMSLIMLPASLITLSSSRNPDTDAEAAVEEGLGDGADGGRAYVCSLGCDTCGNSRVRVRAARGEEGFGELGDGDAAVFPTACEWPIPEMPKPRGTISPPPWLYS